MNDAAFDADAAFGDELDGLRQGFLFGFEDTLGEGLGGVVGVDWDRLLENDWAGVIFVVGEVDSAA